MNIIDKLLPLFGVGLGWGLSRLSERYVDKKLQRK
jgi:hypothetical protein